jgi:hypothetical protein
MEAAAAAAWALPHKALSTATNFGRTEAGRALSEKMFMNI